ncbi:MAG TPA: hypothetical protein PLV92_08780 [Pirellulaceae bacterium]|nr:hypothetical protein [Pirellulaceae bacterium]
MPIASRGTRRSIVRRILAAAMRVRRTVLTNDTLANDTLLNGARTTATKLPKAVSFRMGARPIGTPPALPRPISLLVRMEP